MPTNSQQLITEAKRLEKLQARRRKVRKELRDIETELRLVQKNVRALSRLNDDEQLPPGWKERGIG